MSYQDKHIFRRFPIEGTGPADIRRVYPDEKEGPIFPAFAEADFSSFEGFLMFADGYGLEGFARYSSKLRQELDLWLGEDANINPAPISRNFLKAVWKKIRHRVLYEQIQVREFRDLQQELHRGHKITVLDPNTRQFGGAISFVSGIPHKLKLKSGIDFDHIDRVLEEQVRPTFGLNNTKLQSARAASKLFFIEVKDQPAIAASKIPASSLKEAIEISWHYDSVPARCYSEIAWLINDDKTVVNCQCCKKPFIPKRSDERYCDRVYLDKRGEASYKKLMLTEPAELTAEAKELMHIAAGPDGVSMQAPGEDDEWTAEVRLIPHEEYERQVALVRRARVAVREQHDKARDFRDAHTCKKIGPQRNFQKDHADQQKEYKKYWARKNAAKKKFGAGSPQYKKAATELAKVKIGKPKTKKG